jgi:hypothetical protein
VAREKNRSVDRAEAAPMDPILRGRRTHWQQTGANLMDVRNYVACSSYRIDRVYIAQLLRDMLVVCLGHEHEHDPLAEVCHDEPACADRRRSSKYANMLEQ